MFITFEGIDGAGKTTQMQRLRARLERAGRQVVCTREPGGTTLGDVLRRVLLDPASGAITPRSEALLYAASRAQLVEEVIRPALAAGAVVLCDRFVDASVAYQGEGLALGTEAVAAVNRFATGGLQPDRTILLDVPVALGMQRVRTAGRAADRIEQRGSEYFNRVRERFLRIAASEPQRVWVIDAGRPPDAVEQEIWELVAKWLGIEGDRRTR
ncbi:MAG: dTMP kinase [Alicyclobacillaceae bacterium]|nr:dTMP kinase [Alicyclobacillaceae bacterium]